MFSLTRLSVCPEVVLGASLSVSLHFVSKHKLYSQKVCGGLHPLSSFLCLFAPSLELSKAESHVSLQAQRPLVCDLNYRGGEITGQN